MGKHIYPRAPNKLGLAEKLDYLLDKTGDCWLYMGRCDVEGYGQIKYKGKTLRAHRVAYMLAHGDVTDGLLVCHHCDRPSCCNPAHLFLGTNSDNMADMMKKGRCNRVLSDSIILEIRAATGRNVDVARRLNVSEAAVCQIRNGKAWVH